MLLVVEDSSVLGLEHDDVIVGVHFIHDKVRDEVLDDSLDVLSFVQELGDPHVGLEFALELALHEGAILLLIIGSLICVWWGTTNRVIR